MASVKGMYEYSGRQFDVTRTSPDSVKIGLNCGDHDHEDYIVGTIEGEVGWVVGRKASGYPRDGDTFLEAVQHCAAMLSEECDSLNTVAEVDEFFDNEVVPALKDRLDALAEFLPRFESPDFEFGHMTNRPGTMPYYSFSDDALLLIRVCNDMKWVQPFDWGKWKESPEAAHLRDDPAALEAATADQLQRLLTVLIRQDRFVEGALGSAFESGFLVRILRRAAVLAEDPELERTDDLDSPEQEYGHSTLGDRLELPDGYQISVVEETILCTLDADNPGADVRNYSVATPYLRPDGERIKIRIDETLGHGADPLSAEYRIHDGGDTTGYFRSAGVTLDDPMKLSVEQVFSERRISVDIEKDRMVITLTSDGDQLAESVERCAEACWAVSKLAV